MSAAMYLDHFGLSAPPFRITPNTGCFYSGAKRGATLDALIYSITHDEGIVKVTGEVGSGKTMLCRVLIERLPESVVVIYLANPSLSRQDMLFAIGDELQASCPENARANTVLRALQERLIELYAEGRQVVALIDEAHAMPMETLEEIRLLSNLESNEHKLLQIVLFGQPELDATLARADMRQLKERITQHFDLEPLHRDDIRQYLDFRLRTAGYRGPDLFSAETIRLIANASLGLTRRINIIADKALLSAYSRNTHGVTGDDVRAAIRDARFSGPPAGTRPRWLWPAVAAAMTLPPVAAVMLWPRTPSQAIAIRQTERPEPAVATGAAPATPSAPQVVAVASPTVSPPPLPAADHHSEGGPPESLAEQRLAPTREWIANVPGDRWFIQLLSVDAASAEFVENFLAKAQRRLPLDQIWVYRATTDRGQRIGVAYGQFIDVREAGAAIVALPSELREFAPFPRQARRLK